LQRKQPGTGEWFIRSPEFNEWRVNGGFLWLSGIPGAGKTIISSTIIASLLKQIEGSSTIVVYAYVDFTSDTQQQPESVLRSFLAQLSGQNQDALSALQNLHKQCIQRGSEEPTPEELLSVTLSSFEALTRVYAIVDGLDECLDRATLIRFLKDVQSLPNVSLLALSRNEPDIANGLRGYANMVPLEGPEVDRDIMAYIGQRIGDSEYMQEWDEEVRCKVETKLTGLAGGM